MIQLIEAPPRSGKSYYAVNYLMQFVKYEKLYREYVLDSNVLVIANIEGLKIKHWDLKEILRTQSITDFFTIENFEKIMAKNGKNHVILLIDEAHELFPAGFKNDKIYNFFAYHGHIGLDVFFMTQGLEAMTRIFNPLPELIIKVTPRSKSMPRAFSYGFYDKAGKFMYSEHLRKKPLVFQAYTSFRMDEKNKPKNALLHWVVISVVMVVVSIGAFKYCLSSVSDMGKSKMKSHTAPVVSVVAPLAPVVSVPVAAVQRPLSSARVPLSAPVPVSVPFVAANDLPRVIGLVGDLDGKNRSYLLSTGQVFRSKHIFHIGDIYIR